MLGFQVWTLELRSEEKVAPLLAQFDRSVCRAKVVVG